MKLGLNLGYWGARQRRGQPRAGQEADALGFSVAWVAEAYGSDAPTVLAFVAAQTERIDVGSAIFQIPGRTPANCAMTAATLDTLSGGRFRLGLGVSGPQVSEGWHGVALRQAAGPHPRVQRHRQARAVAGRRSATTGEHYVLPLPDGPGKALQLTVHPVREHIPIYLAAVGPKNLELSGELFDGWLAIFYSPELRAGASSRSIAAGRAKVGKTLDGFDVVPTVPIVVGDDPQACADPIRGTPRSTSAAWAAARRTSTTSSPSGWASTRPPRQVQDLYLSRETTTRPPRRCRSSSSTRPRCSGPRSGSPRRCRTWPRSGVTTLTAVAVRRLAGRAARRRCAPPSRRSSWPGVGD